MKFNPCFIEAFRSGQKTTTLRRMDFKCTRCDGYKNLPPAYVHGDTLKYRMRMYTIEDIELCFPPGTAVAYTTDLTGLLERQPYRQGDEIALVTEIEGGETAPFATATIEQICVIRGGDITDEHAISDGFNPKAWCSALGQLYVFMQDIYPDADPKKEMYWLYTFTHIQMLPMQGGEA
ncbi:TPA: hypothetical protein I8Y21_004576 [Klebsiella oxytoca]|uniref:ASCH domain-containing protein n=1 Tax=Klebsiella oxytoca TaxID=571 RepID=A0AAN5LCB3_KLEOX|nr:hypothetical protein [Klebsiella oxytoca]